LRLQESNLLEEMGELECGSVNEPQLALEKAGIQFIAKNGGGPGVRLKQ
jgi:hypothetical protein